MRRSFGLGQRDENRMGTRLLAANSNDSCTIEGFFSNRTETPDDNGRSCGIIWILFLFVLIYFLSLWSTMIGAFALRCCFQRRTLSYPFCPRCSRFGPHRCRSLVVFLGRGHLEFRFIIPPKVTIGWYLVVRIPDSPSLWIFIALLYSNRHNLRVSLKIKIATKHFFPGERAQFETTGAHY